MRVTQPEESSGTLKPVYASICRSLGGRVGGRVESRRIGLLLLESESLPGFRVAGWLPSRLAFGTATANGAKFETGGVAAAAACRTTTQDGGTSSSGPILWARKSRCLGALKSRCSALEGPFSTALARDGDASYRVAA